MRLFSLGLMLLVSLFHAEAQHQLTGKITHKDTQEGVLATIYIPQLEKGTTSDFDGHYQITNIPDGTYTIVYSSIGFKTQSHKIQFTTTSTYQKDITMEESAVEMEEVIISTPFHQLQSENVMRVERASVEQLKSSGAITLAEGVKTIPGVEIITTGPGIGKPVIRGLSSNRVLTFTQGVRLENQQFGDEHGLGINDSGIESVEVIKGPASLLYGSDALGGVLYINPEKFLAPGKTAFDAGSTFFTNTLGSSTDAGVKTSFGSLGFLARGTIASHSDYKTGSDYRVSNSRFQEKDIKAGLQLSKEKYRSTLRYNYNRSDLGIPEDLFPDTHSKSLTTPFQEVDNHILSLDNRFFLNNSKIDATLGYLMNDRREFEDEFETPDLQMVLKTFNYDLKYHFPEFGKFQTIIGLQGMFQKNKNKALEVLIPNATTRDVGLLATTHYHLDQIDIQAGIRFDQRRLEAEAVPSALDENYRPALDRTFNSFTASLGGKIDVFEKTSLRINLASGFRAPNLAELTSQGIHEGTYRYERGNKNLVNERNLEADISLEYRNNHIEFAVNGFYNLLDNYIYLSPTDQVIDDTPVYDYLQSHAVLYGGEIGFHLHPHPIDWLHWESNYEMVIGKDRDGNSLPLIPAHGFSNTLRIEKDHFPRAFIRLETVFKQNQPHAMETSTPGYALVHAGIHKTFKWPNFDVKAGLTANNLLNKAYVNHLSRFKNQDYLNPGRNIMFNLRFMWK